VAYQSYKESIILGLEVLSLSKTSNLDRRFEIMEKTKFSSFVLLLVIAMISFGSWSCTKSVVGACRELATNPDGKYKYNRNQSKAACAVINRYLAGKYSEEKKTWAIDYTRILETEEVIEYIDDQLKSVDKLLGYRDEDLARFIDWWKGFRKALERQERRLRYVKSRLNYVINYNKYADTVGEADSETVTKLMPYGRKNYSIRLIYPLYDLGDLKFVADYVENAKRENTLKLVDEFKIIESKEFAEKVVDKDDPNKFRWKSHYRGWLIKAYKILPDKEQPSEANIDYLEIHKAKFREVKDGSKVFESFESQFAVSGFKGMGNDKVNVFVIDYDFDVIKGLSPDKIYKTFLDVVYGNELYAIPGLKTEVLDVLFDPPIAKEKEHRKKPPEKPLYVEIAKMGDVDAKLWEESLDGFKVPFAYSKHGPGKYDTDIEIMWKKPKSQEEKLLEEQGLKQIEYVKLLYKKSSNTQVIEYYILKDEYAERNVKEADPNNYADTLKIRRDKKPEESSEVEWFVKRVKAIDYLYGGWWWRILDKDDDGVFERKRKIADPTEKSTVSTHSGRWGGT
jgi:hypothetical protein